MKKNHFNAAMAFSLVAILFCVGCVPTKVQKLASVNLEAYKGELKKKVSEEIGSDYSLSGIECEIIDWGEPVNVYGPDGSVSKGSRYEAENALTARVIPDNDTVSYDVKYYWDTDTLETNAFYPAIVDDYAAHYLGLNPDKIIYRKLCDLNGDSFIIPSDIRTAEEFFSLFNDRGWSMTILTEENISNRYFADYHALCHEDEISDGLTIFIYSTDDIDNFGEFKSNHQNIKWFDPKVHPNDTPYLSYVPDREYDIFERYNLNNAVRISFPAPGQEVKVYQY